MMTIESILQDKTLKPKAKTELIGSLLAENALLINELLALARKLKDPDKATLIEAVEHASLKNAEVVTEEMFLLAIESLASKSPRVKWESARVIGNTAGHHPRLLEQAMNNLLNNTEFPETVVRWSAAFALGEIIKLKTAHNDALIPAAQAILEREDQNSIRKIYLAAMKKAAKS